MSLPNPYHSELNTSDGPRAMRRLAEAALAAYDLPPARLTLIAHLYNTTFRVDTADGQRYMLRIHRAGTPTVDTVGSELAWLAALRRDTLLQVPSPVPTRDGSLLTVASVPGVASPHICVLFRWLYGRRFEHGLTPRHLELTGELMARLQNHAERWERPPGFVRGRVDYPMEAARWAPDPFAPEVLASVRNLMAGALSTKEANAVAATLERVRAIEQTLRDEPGAFGLIHADLHFRNLLFADGAAQAIDFDDCGLGPVLYDPAVMLSELHGRPDYADLRAGLLAGYRRARPLSAEHESWIDLFIALRRIQDATWVVEWRKHPAIGGDWAAQARRALDILPLREF